jgi:hypothetical protein
MILLDELFSSWIVVWYLLYMVGILPFSPKYWFIIALAVILGLALYLKITLSIFIVGICMNLFFKVMPLYTMRNDPCRSCDVFFGFFLLVIYLLWIQYKKIDVIELYTNRLTNENEQGPLSAFILTLFKDKLIMENPPSLCTMDLHKKSRLELLQICRDLHIKQVSTLKKEDLLEKIKSHDPEQIPNERKNTCKQCGEVGHGMNSVHCQININKKEIIKQKVAQHFLSQDGSDDSIHFQPLSESLDISIEQCKVYYNEIPWLDLLRRKNTSSILEKLTFNTCEQCDKKKCTIQGNPFRIWKGKHICDKCFVDTSDEREELWKQINTYKPIQCCFCKMTRDHKDERFQFDHINMFDKENTIYSMVIEGVNIEEIYKEIDKCQILCFSCHQIVSYTERTLGFTKQKQNLTRKYNKEEITKEEYEVELKKYQTIYDEIMPSIYEDIKTKHLLS